MYVLVAVTLLFPSSGSVGPVGSVMLFPFTYAVFPILPAAFTFTVAVIVYVAVEPPLIDNVSFRSVVIPVLFPDIVPVFTDVIVQLV